MKKALKRLWIQILITVLRLHRAPRVVRQCTLLFVLSFVVLEIPTLLKIVFPVWAQQTSRDWFLWPGIVLKTDYQLVWMFTFCAKDIQVILLVLIGVKLAKQYSPIIFIISVLVLFYVIIDALMLWICFKLWHYVYFDMITTFLILMKGAFKGYKPTTFGKLKSIF
jgi:hypothetical protein